MTKFTLVTMDDEETNNVMSRDIELPFLPPVGSAIQLPEGIFMVLNITFVETGQIFLLVEPRDVEVEDTSAAAFIIPQHGSNN